MIVTREYSTIIINVTLILLLGIIPKMLQLLIEYLLHLVKLFNSLEIHKYFREGSRQIRTMIKMRKAKSMNTHLER